MPFLIASIWPTHAMPLMLFVLCTLAVAYRYYSAFLAAKVAVLDDARVTPAMAHADGQNYDPTNKWVLFGHHFAAISGAGPLIGPVLAAQFGYMPGILWIVIGVCLGGAAQDFLVLAASIRRDGKSLAQIARDDVGPWAGRAAAAAILFILIIALAGLGKVVVKALGGDKVSYPASSVLTVPLRLDPLVNPDNTFTYFIPPGANLAWKDGLMKFQENFTLVSPTLLSGSAAKGSLKTRTPAGTNSEDPKSGNPALRSTSEPASAVAPLDNLAQVGDMDYSTLSRYSGGGKGGGFLASCFEAGDADQRPMPPPQPSPGIPGEGEMRAIAQGHLRTNPVLQTALAGGMSYPIPAKAYRVQPGSAWGTFTIAATIPIALFVGFYMYKIRKGKVVEASLIGGGLTLFATFLGGWVSHQPWGRVFNLTEDQVVYSMAIYGFIAAVLPVWVLLCPRDYLSSFLKIGTIALLVAGTLIANPKLEAPAFNHVFAHGGPIVPGNVFPFLFITIMCGAISGFHALVSSGTTPKMIRKESDARMIGYGAMQIEGLVAVVAMVAAATLPSADYYAMNTDLDKVPKWQAQIAQVDGDIVGGTIDHLQVYEKNTQESLRGRTGGAVTLAVGMAHIFDQAAGRFWTGSQDRLQAAWKYWYHFAIMFEALFILTTIDAGTRIGRFLLQEIMGKVYAPLGRTSWAPGALLSTALIVLGWVYFIQSGSMSDIWPVFGIGNQMLAVIALAVVSAYLANEGRARYLWATVLPMLVVATTTTTAAAEKLAGLLGNSIVPQWHNMHHFNDEAFTAILHAGTQAVLIVAMLFCGAVILVSSAMRVWKTINGRAPSETSSVVMAK